MYAMRPSNINFILYTYIATSKSNMNISRMGGSKIVGGRFGSANKPSSKPSY
jgi:hypothetical protein